MSFHRPKLPTLPKRTRIPCRTALEMRRKFDKATVLTQKWRLFSHMERETGIEPATNGLGSRYSTIELLPPAATRLF
jgi:hypothetical protein